MKIFLQLDEVKRFITLALRAGRTPKQDEELIGLFERLGDDASFALAERHQVQAAVATSLFALLPEHQFSLSWLTFYQQNMHRVRALIEATAVVCEKLQSEEIACGAIEAGGVMVATSLSKTAYGSGDIDLLVAPGRDVEVDAIFASEGFSKVDRPHRRPTSRREYRRQLDPDTTLFIDAGSVAFERYWVPFDLEVSSDAWLERRVRSAKDSRISVLDATDLLLQVAIHTSTHAYVLPPGFRLQLDVDRVVRDLAVDWKRFLRDVISMRGQRRVYYSLAMAVALMGTPIPEKVLTALAPPRWQRRAFSALMGESYAGDGLPRLGRAQRTVLDRLIDSRSTRAWLRSLILPNASWMHANFGEKTDEKLLSLYVRRYRRILRTALRESR